MQARKVVGGATGLIPSQFLEEKRKAFVRRDCDNSGTGLYTFDPFICSLVPVIPLASAPPCGGVVYNIDLNSGILCGTKTMKKRKKMMYLTSKNAGLCPFFI